MQLKLKVPLSTAKQAKATHTTRPVKSKLESAKSYFLARRKVYPE
jgi:hypothetical protein